MMKKKIKFPKISFSTLRRFVFIVIVLTGVFSAGYLVSEQGIKVSVNRQANVSISREAPEEYDDVDFSLFWKVWDTLETRYFDKEKLIPSKMVYGAIGGMVSALGDPYTVFLPPKDNKVVQEDLKGSFSGVGIQIGFKGSHLAVIAPLPGSPAESVGVKAGDLIVGIRDDVKEINRGTAGITLPEAVQTIRGPKGSQVALTLLRGEEEETFEVTITRDTIEVPSLIIDFVGDESQEGSKKNIAHIQILKFVAETPTDWEEVVIDVLKNPNVDGIILDVRNNPGGYLQAAVDLASDFLEVGTVVVTEEKSSGEVTEFKVDRIGRLRDREVVVLVNKGSASASEILSGALRDVKEYQIVGDTTFGKGTIQEPQQIENGAGLHITVARWLTPSGFWVNEGGIVPDVEIADDPETDEDEQLIEAIKLLSD